MEAPPQPDVSSKRLLKIQNQLRIRGAELVLPAPTARSGLRLSKFESLVSLLNAFKLHGPVLDCPRILLHTRSLEARALLQGQRLTGPGSRRRLTGSMPLACHELRQDAMNRELDDKSKPETLIEIQLASLASVVLSL